MHKGPLRQMEQHSDTTNPQHPAVVLSPGRPVSLIGAVSFASSQAHPFGQVAVGVRVQGYLWPLLPGQLASTPGCMGMVC